MNISCIEKENAVIMNLEGHFQTDEPQKLVDSIDAKVRAGKTRIIINMQNVRSINSRCLSALISAQKNTAQHNGALILSSIQSSIAELLKLTKLDTKFNICASDKEALELS